MEKGRESAPKEQFLLFSTICFQLQEIKLHILVKFGCSTYFFLNSANLVCGGTDSSTYFSESFGLRDNERRLYMLVVAFEFLVYVTSTFDGRQREKWRKRGEELEVLKERRRGG